MLEIDGIYRRGQQYEPQSAQGHFNRLPVFIESHGNKFKVVTDGNFLEKIRALYKLLVFPDQNCPKKISALEWLNGQGVFSVMIDGAQVPCRFILRGRSGSEVVCIIDSQKAKSIIVSNTGVTAEMRLCIYMPMIFDNLLQQAPTVGYAAQIVKSSSMQSLATSLLGGMKIYRQVITPLPDMEGKL